MPLLRRTILTTALVLLTVWAVVPETDAPPLKDLVPRGWLIGAAVAGAEPNGRDGRALPIAARHFNTITPENLLKWERVHPRPDRYAFEPADRLVEYGRANGLAVIGHVLVWHQQTPRRVFEGDDGRPVDRDTLLARMREHIHAVAGRYRGRIHGWDVVNEALEDDGTMRKSPWLEIAGEDFVARAFEYAREADPGAELYYNDYNLWKPSKRDAAVRLVASLRAQGLRVDGIGEQGHWLLERPDLDDVDAMIRTFARAGFPTHITELDVDVLPREPEMMGADLAKTAEFREATNLYPHGLTPEGQRRLAERYAAIFRLFLRHREHVRRVTFWGVSDGTSWLNNFPIRGRVNHPLLWDRDWQPKPAFDAVVSALKDHQER